LTTRAERPVVLAGAGPCGLAAAIALQDADIPSIVLDKGAVVQSIANYPTNLTMFSTPEKLVIGGVPFECAGFRPTRRETMEYYRRVVTERGIDVRSFTEVLRVERDVSGLTVCHVEPRSVMRRTPARAVVVATGYFDYPNLLGVEGENLAHVTHRFVDGHEAFGRDAVVVGGGNSAVECAIELARCGARVTVVHYEPAFVSHAIKPWILPEFEERVAAGQIVTRFNTRVTSIGLHVITIATEELLTRRESELPARHVYLMTGYTPRPGLLGALGVPFDDETGIPAHNPETMETPVPGVFVAGVLTSGKKANGVFIENGRGHGALIAAELSRRGAGRS
jgi:thioredoxin reductase (NADPH)